MHALWFTLVAGMFAAYAVLDGFDLGVGMLLPLVARDKREREAALESIGPVWDGNEVFLVAGGGTLYLAFPKLFGVFASGFYLPIHVVLWLLVGRAIGLEMRHKVHHALWEELCDGLFFVSSLLLAIFLGVALGNVVRGVTLDADGDFFAPLWTDLRVGANVGVIDAYTALVGVTVALVLAHHGALWLATRAPALRTSARRWAERMWVPVLVSTAVATLATFRVQPLVPRHLAERPWGAALGVVAVVSLGAALVLRRRGRDLAAFRASACFVGALFACACFGIYPYALPDRAGGGLRASDVAASDYALTVGLVWWVPGMIAVALYFGWVYRRTTCDD